MSKVDPEIIFTPSTVKPQGDLKIVLNCVCMYVCALNSYVHILLEVHEWGTSNQNTSSS